MFRTTMKGKLGLSALLLALVISLAPAFAFAAPIETDVVIHKMKVNTSTDLAVHDGEEITDFTGTNLQGATPLQGIIFKYWTVSPSATPTHIAALNGITTLQAAEAYASANPTILLNDTLTNPTNALGFVTVSALPEGIYFFVELNGPEQNVTEYIGVPFLLELPAMKATGTAYFGTDENALHVYPKNATYHPGLDLETRDAHENSAGLRIGSSSFQIAKLNAITGDFELVTEAGSGGLLSLPNGVITLADLPSGDYRLVNTGAPNGYLVDSRPIFFTVSAGVISFDSTTSNPRSYFTAGTDPDNAKITLILSKIPIPEKEVNGSSSATAQIGELLYWKVTVPVPTEIADYGDYRIVDTLDSKLSWGGNDGEGDVVVASGLTQLIKGTHYTTSVSGQVLTVNFIPSALASFADETLTVSYTTYINSTAIMGEDTYNNAELQFDNGHEGSGTTEPPAPPSVWTGGAKFRKLDAANNNILLQGAEFKIATNPEGTFFVKWSAELLDANTLASFVNPQNGADIVMLSNATGLFEIKGLAGGTYYLVETKAPTYNGATYNLLREPALFAITKESFETTNTIDVENRRGLQIPQTGGIGTAVFTIVGLALMTLAVFLFRKKKKAPSE